MDSASLIMLIVLIAIFYFMLIRPENKRKKQAQEMRDILKKGDVITTIGGIVGKIVMVTGETIVIETSEDRVRMELAKWAVSTVSGQTPDASPSKKKEKKDEREGKEEKSIHLPIAEAPAEAPAEEAAAPAESEEKKDS